ncbi:UDP-glucose 4-epimerase [Erysiphe neolycopersici]|uniref:UDP-glucose 4-epimerase n=1 Tax=Erysiphe neolycopersici TaxID=212602 RepID=A0A420HWU6_9PEZI|nr:UDP-glucose 4-epimerase [Erysiphe neolycopersici]
MMLWLNVLQAALLNVVSLLKVLVRMVDMDSSDSEVSSSQLSGCNPNSSPLSELYLSPTRQNSSEENFRPVYFPEDKFIAVIGGLGYIGSHTCLELLRAGYNVLIIDNLSNSFDTTQDQILYLARQYHNARGQKVPQLKFYEADYRDEIKIKKILSDYISPDLRTPDMVPVPKSKILGVIHFAAYKSVVESIKYPLKYYDNNVAGLVKFCIILNEFNIKTFIFSSSATVYGSKANSEVLLREEHCVHQTESYYDQFGIFRTSEPGCTGLTNPYGRSKWMSEAILSDIATADRNWAITALRYFNPIGCDGSGLLGEDPRGVPTNLMPVVMRVLSGQIPGINIFGVDYPNTHDGTAVRDYIHVTDLARGHISALESAIERKGFRTYNLGSGIGYSVRDIIEAVEKVFCCKIPTQFAPRREGDVEMSVALPKRAEDELKWKTEKSLNDACKDLMSFISLRKIVNP